MTFIPKIKGFNAIKQINNKHKFQNLIFIFVALFLLCFCAFKLVLDFNNEKINKIMGFPKTYHYFVVIMLDKDYGITLDGWSNLSSKTVMSGRDVNWIDNYQEQYEKSLFFEIYEDFPAYITEPAYEKTYPLTLDFDNLNQQFRDNNKSIKYLYATDSSGAEELRISANVELTTSNFTQSIFVAENWYGDELCYAYPLYIEWEPEIEINYYNQNSAEFNGTHTSDYATKHINGIKTSLDAPTRVEYKFDGWYLNDPSCTNESAKVTVLSADIDYETISLYAKWIALDITLTLTCDNFDSQRYMIYIYSGETLKMQISPTKQTETIELEAVSNYTTTPYKVCFVFGYYGKIEFTSLSNATYIGRNATITTFATTAISYTIATPQINSSIMI